MCKEYSTNLFSRMSSILRVRTRHFFGAGTNGLSLQHSYEIAHMSEETDGEDDPIIDDVMRKFYELALPAIHCVERLSFYFSNQFSFRIGWSSSSCKFYDYFYFG